MACGASPDRATSASSARAVDAAPADRHADRQSDRAPRDATGATLAQPFGAAPYRVERGPDGRPTGTVRGRVLVNGAVPEAVTVTPTHDEHACAAFVDTVVPSRAGGVGNAVVWLTGLTTGAPPAGDRRMSLALEDCRIAPRVLLVPVGATLLVSSGDAMRSRLRFIDAAGQGTVRATMDFSDAGQLIPSSAVAATPAILSVRDDLHPWVRGTVVVTPHPFVAITAPDGAFQWAAVPDGLYTLWVWQEALGLTSQRVRVHASVETRVDIRVSAR